MTAVIESVDTCPEDDLRALADTLSQTCEEFADSLHACLRHGIETIRCVVRGVLNELKKQRFREIWSTPPRPVHYTLEEQEDRALAIAYDHMGKWDNEHWERVAAGAKQPVEEVRRNAWALMVTSLRKWD